MSDYTKLPGRLFICYHGTSKENYDSILKTGFREWTYFGKNLEDAIQMGRGEYVFEVVFSEKEHHNPDFWKDPDKWQFMCRETIPVDRIVGIHHIVREELFKNEELVKVIEKSHDEYDLAKDLIDNE